MYFTFEVICSYEYKSNQHMQSRGGLRNKLKKGLFHSFDFQLMNEKRIKSNMRLE